MFTVYTTKV